MKSDCTCPRPGAKLEEALERVRGLPQDHPSVITMTDHLIDQLSLLPRWDDYACVLCGGKVPAGL